MYTFGELGVAAYCPRQLWYHRRDDGSPGRASGARALANRYPALLAGEVSEDELDASPETVRRRLRHIAERFSEAWSELQNPTETAVRVQGRDVRGEVAKLLGTDPPTPTLVSDGTPPETGVWQTQSVRGVAAALAVAWERDREVRRVFIEYPRHGIVREIRVTARRRATFRRVRRTVAELGDPPPRIDDDAKCSGCSYQGECGVRTRSLSSLWGS